MKPEHLETLLGKYIAKNGQVNPQFSKQVNLLSDSDKKKVWHEVKVRELDKQRDRVRRQYVSSQAQAAQVELTQATEEIPVVTEAAEEPFGIDVVIVGETLAAAAALSKTPVPQEVPQDNDDLDEDDEDSDDDDEDDEEEVEDSEVEDRTYKSRGPGRGPRIMWTEDEWDKLAETVYGMRRKYVIPALAKLVNRAMKQFPADRRRNLQGTTLLKPLLERLQAMEAEEKTKAEDYTRYRSQIQQMGKIPTREEILTTLTDEDLAKVKIRVLAALTPDDMQIVKDKLLTNLTDEEITTRFSQTVFDNHTPAQLMAMVDEEDVLDCLPFSKVFGFVAEHFMESIEQFGSQFSNLLALPLQTPGTMFKQMRPPHKQPEVAAPRVPQAPAIPRVTRVEKTKVTVLGVLTNQEQFITHKLGDRCDFTFIEADRSSKSIPDGQDVIVLWARFTNHSVQSHAKSKAINGTRLITHHGGLKKMVEKIEQVINGEIVQPTRPGSGVGVN